MASQARDVACNMIFLLYNNLSYTKYFVYSYTVDLVLIPSYEVTPFVMTLWHGNTFQVPDSKVHGANRAPTWVLSVPDGPHDGLMNLAIRDIMEYFGGIHWPPVNYPPKRSLMLSFDGCFLPLIWISFCRWFETPWSSSQGPLLIIWINFNPGWISNHITL